MNEVLYYLAAMTSKLCKEHENFCIFVRFSADNFYK